MIASLRGTVEAIGSEWAIINVGGVGFKVYMPTSTLSELGAAGEEARLHTHLHVREDHVTLYGFTSAPELGLFQTLLGVSGIGPKLAVAMLSTMNVEKLTTAIATGNVEILTEVPGVGKKIASRVILELKDKISAGWVTTPGVKLAAENTEVMTALNSLGYSVSEASQAMAALPLDSKLNLEEKIRLALQYFGSKK
jgi:Holliday junction DNA helicase RuvA